jgi:GalNAc-alpha-(1->4)-GalNAc-alpha-(1->3)-diNAcBac-PP-undecaprenol alpha-1,4-N-acetyl-D-galactosaminyltransferase
MSNAMIEAMCVGTPVISTKVSGTDELIENGSNGLLVELRDVDGLARAFDQLLSDNDLQSVFASLSLSMSSKFKIDTIVGEWEKLIDSVVER